MKTNGSVVNGDHKLKYPRTVLSVNYVEHIVGWYLLPGCHVSVVF